MRTWLLQVFAVAGVVVISGLVVVFVNANLNDEPEVIMPMPCGPDHVQVWDVYGTRTECVLGTDYAEYLEEQERGQ